jgi:YegS/Rv2252/BmrU family lipid kinase
MARYKVIFNPESNKGANVPLFPEIEKELQTQGLDFDIFLTDHPWHAAELAQSAKEEGYDVVVAGGGDGTSNEVINGIMLARENGADVTMGTIPIGRGNDFNYGINNPEDWRESVAVLAAGKTRMVDVGHLSGGLYPEGRYFGNQIGIGFDSVVGFLAAEQRITGFPGYLIAAIRTMWIYHPAPVLKFTLDDEEFEQPCLMLTMMNGSRAGGGFMIAPHHVIDDGLFDVCRADSIPRPKIFPLLFRFIQGTQFGHPAIHYHKASQVEVTAVSGSIPAHADGETICTEGESLSIRMLPQALRVIVADEAPSAEEDAG